MGFVNVSTHIPDGHSPHMRDHRNALNRNLPYWQVQHPSTQGPSFPVDPSTQETDQACALT